MDFGQDDAADQKRQNADARFDGVGVKEIVGFAPVRVGKSDTLDPEAGMQPAPPRFDVARDDELAAGGLRDGVGDGLAQRAQPEREKKRDHDEENEYYAADPLQSTHNHS